MGLSRLIVLGIYRSCKTGYNPQSLVVTLQMFGTYVNNTFHISMFPKMIPLVRYKAARDKPAISHKRITGRFSFACNS